MQVTLDPYKSKLAGQVSATSKIALYGLRYPQNWHLLYLCRMNIVALERNNEYIAAGIDVLTDEEVLSMTSFLDKHL